MRRVLTHAHQLGVGAEAVSVDAEHLVAHRELGDPTSDGFDDPRQLGSEHRSLRPGEAAEEADDERLALAKAAVGPVDGRGTDADAHLIVVRDGRLDIDELQHVRRPVPLVAHCSHVGDLQLWSR